MRFRIKDGTSAYRFVYERTPRQPLPPANTSLPPRAAELDNPYGRYYTTARSREDLKKNRTEQA